jgi:hypothetical protein
MSMTETAYKIEDNIYVKETVARTPNFIHKPCIISSTNIQTYDKTSHCS